MDHFNLCFIFCYAVLSVSRSRVITCWKRADILACFPIGVLGQVYVWYLVVSIPDLCPPLNVVLTIYKNTSF